MQMKIGAGSSRFYLFVSIDGQVIVRTDFEPPAWQAIKAQTEKGQR